LDDESILQIRNLDYGGNRCLDAKDEAGEMVVTYQCHEMGTNQYFELHIFTNNMLHIKRDRLCLEFDGVDLKMKQQYMVRKGQVSETMGAYLNDLTILSVNFSIPEMVLHQRSPATSPHRIPALSRDEFNFLLANEAV
jgi:hypothetical protein